ncbi:thiamine-phosphate kinase [Embleya scabrispora]|uniref:thiamine-phosphate kinase n=1 Tax=Embleya scabrispora TaxID=159449 RepID=UPI000366680C|nr:thiamine-phosphate kinase [Embleya scabrispora]MYS82233.1 thiamine-phosphate kinase [Streptomyces sp. SID5474]
MSGTLGDLGEFGLIGALVARVPTGPHVSLGPGDDAAVVAAADGRVVATMDLLVEGRHFRRDWSTAYDVGRKAAAQNLADVAAMGAAPTALLIGLCGPPDLPTGWALELYDGLRDECAVVGAGVAGGDVVGSDTVTVAVTALGDLQGRPPVVRSGARPGDVLAVAGWLGWSAAGLAILGHGHRAPRAFVEAHRRPEPPYDAGPGAAILGATSMIDVSDGLLADMGHVSRASDVRIDILSARLDVPAQMRDVARALGADPLNWVLTGGEDHALVATFPAGTALPARWRVIGRVHSGAGVTVDGRDPGLAGGWDHFGRG